jgi:hypothetical protein
MENTCFYVSSRGIAKTCNFYPTNIVSDTSNEINYLLDLIKNKDKMFDNMSIYVITNTLSYFVSNIIPHINKKFILVSGASTKTSPVEALNQKQFFYLINNKFLIHWCSQNNTIQNFNKIIQIPLGLDYHTISNNPNHNWRDKNEGFLPYEQELILINISKLTKPFYDRKIKIFVNYDTNNDQFKQRKESLMKISKNIMDINLNKMKRTKTWQITTEYAFVLSPYGNGMDCHRTWEALILGSIPIICSKEFKKMFEDLPVLNVNDWKDVNQSLLDKTIEEFKNRSFNYDKLTLQYWKNIIFVGI